MGVGGDCTGTRKGTGASALPERMECPAASISAPTRLNSPLLLLPVPHLSCPALISTRTSREVPWREASAAKALAFSALSTTTLIFAPEEKETDEDKEAESNGA
jgi:hypothetical protein